nr:uncharacterized protein LOC109780780 [Aegilops tauschii subsp. strangulata]
MATCPPVALPFFLLLAAARCAAGAPSCSATQARAYRGCSPPVPYCCSWSAATAPYAAPPRSRTSCRCCPSPPAPAARVARPWWPRPPSSPRGHPSACAGLAAMASPLCPRGHTSVRASSSPPHCAVPAGRLWAVATGPRARPGCRRQRLGPPRFTRPVPTR